MGYSINVFGSSSKGNCIFVDTGDCKFLLDAGLSLKETKQQLFELDVGLSDIDYILISHNHGDHVKGLESILKTYNIKVIGSKGALKDRKLAHKMTYIKSGQTINLPNLAITAKDVSHDADEPLCFSIQNSLGEKLLYLTDCGIARYLKFPNHTAYIVEANYDKGILEKALTAKQYRDKIRYDRNVSGTGHLSIDETIEFLSRNIGDKTEQIILSHLSSDHSDKDEFLNRAINALFFFNINIARKGLHIECGSNSTPF